MKSEKGKVIVMSYYGFYYGGHVRSDRAPDLTQESGGRPKCKWGFCSHGNLAIYRMLKFGWEMGTYPGRSMPMDTTTTRSGGPKTGFQGPRSRLSSGLGLYRGLLFAASVENAPGETGQSF